MSEESKNALCELIEGKINYYRREFDISYGEVVLVLEFIKFKMLKEAFDAEEMDKEKVIGAG